MFRRSRAPTDPVTIHLDGEPLPAERGEPLAAALLAADKTIIARSPKLHRPRGPSCFRGGCDGCLARVDGVPNVMLCQTPARGGEQISAQNVVGSRRADLLRLTDWFFAKGIDHHHMLAGVPGLSTVMQSFAAKVAGLGRLPGAEDAPHPARRLAVDVAVVGGGPAGIAAASVIAVAGRRVALINDGLALGGALAGAPDRAAALLGACPLPGVTILSRSVAAGSYDGELLVVTPERCLDGAASGPKPPAPAGAEAIIVRPRATVYATGAHDGTLAVPGNDKPGVFSARALCRLIRRGIEPDGPVAIVVGGFWADELERALGDAPKLRIQAADLIDIRGTAGVHGVTVRAPGSGDLLTHSAAVVALALPGAPSFELPAQAGAAVRFDPNLGYVVSTDARGRIADDAWAVGECTGQPFDPEALRAAGERVGKDVVAALG